MISQDLQKRIRHLEITTRKQISGPLLGEAQSALKGSGFEFNQLREYSEGDDIRFIDWKASARGDKMLVRQYLEDRNRTIYLVVDVSASTEYGSQEITKSELMKQLAGVLAFVSLHKKDSLGLILFSDTIEKVIPPRQSRSHTISVVNTIFSYKAQRKTTALSAPIEYLARLKGQKAIVCLISDFMAPLDKKLISLGSRKHDFLAFRCLDPRELSFPDVGTLRIEDSETGVQSTVAGSGASALNQALVTWQERQKELLISAKIDLLDLRVGGTFSGELVKFLRQRVYG